MSDEFGLTERLLKFAQDPKGELRVIRAGLDDILRQLSVSGVPSDAIAALMSVATRLDTIINTME